MKILCSLMNWSFIALVLVLPLLSFQLANEVSTSKDVLNSCPTAMFNVQNNGCDGPCEVAFANESVNAVAFHWDFGDGNTSADSNPQNTYLEPGTYTVKLTAIGLTCTNDFIGTVEIIGQ